MPCRTRRRRRVRGWNRVPDKVRAEVIDLALQKTELSARELACHFTDERRYFPERIERVPHPQGRGSDHEPGVRADERVRPFQAPNSSA